MRHSIFYAFAGTCLLAASLSCSPSHCHAQLIVAHRGASHDAPENTLAAFHLAWEKEADAIEGDFYVTKDNQIVCIHDKSTKRTAPDQKEMVISESTLQQLRTLDVGRWKHPQFSGETIPTLREVLATVPPGKQIFVEVKCGTEILPLLKPQLDSSGLQPEQIVIICFNEDVISGARRSMPQYKANWLTSYKQTPGTKDWKPSRGQVLATLQRTSATGLGTNGNTDIVNEAFVQAVCAEHEFHVWTINDEAAARRFSLLGAASITTDRPDLIRQCLQIKAESTDAP